MNKLKFITDEMIEKVKSHRCNEITKVERELFKKQVLYDFRDIKEFIKTTRITKYGLYIYFKDKLNLYTNYMFISYMELRDIDNIYIENIVETIQYTLCDRR